MVVTAAMLLTSYWYSKVENPDDDNPDDKKDDKKPDDKKQDEPKYKNEWVNSDGVCE